MTVQTLTVSLPETLYQRLQAAARTSARAVEDVVVQTLARALPPPIEDDLPPALRDELKAMERLSDDALWQLARATLNADKVALYDVLLERNQAGALTAEGRELLARLREEAEALTLRKAHAFSLLNARGVPLPTLEQLKAASA
ncbi:MAG: hypothetical protein HY784_05065 [Chloroflexi bacterium]|nr:hypothetical protein [Chloroflexota bacterium]